MSDYAEVFARAGNEAVVLTLGQMQEALQLLRALAVAAGIGNDIRPMLPHAFAYTQVWQLYQQQRHRQAQAYQHAQTLRTRRNQRMTAAGLADMQELPDHCTICGAPDHATPTCLGVVLGDLVVLRADSRPALLTACNPITHPRQVHTDGSPVRGVACILAGRTLAFWSIPSVYTPDASGVLVHVLPASLADPIAIQPTWVTIRVTMRPFAACIQHMSMRATASGMPLITIARYGGRAHEPPTMTLQNIHLLRTHNGRR